MALDNNTGRNWIDKTTIKNWFKRGLKPTQEQFWSTWDSFWHKDEKLPISSIDKLGGLLDGKAETSHKHDIYATNNATSLTDENVISWQQALGIDNLDYVEIPTENATEQSHPYVVVIDDEGNSAKRNAKEFGKVDKIMGVSPDENKNVDISGVEMNWTSPTQRFSAIPDKSADATYNQLLGVDSNGYAAKVGLNAVTNAMAKSSDAQKDAFRLASRKSTEGYSTGQPRVDTILPPVIDNTKDYIQYVTLVGINLFVNNGNISTASVSIVRYKDINNQLIPEETHVIDNYQVYQTNTSILSFGIDYSLFQTGYYKVKVVHNGLINIGSSDILVTTQVTNNPIILDSWEMYTPFEPTNLVVTNTSIKKTYGSIIRGSTVIEQQVKHFVIKQEDVLSGFRLNFIFKLTPSGTELGNVMARQSLTFGLGYDQNVNGTVVPEILLSIIRGRLTVGLVSEAQPLSISPLIYEIDIVVKNSLATIVVTLKNTGKVLTTTFSFEQKKQQMYFYSTFLGSNPDTPAQIAGSTQELLFPTTYQSF